MSQAAAGLPAWSVAVRMRHRGGLEIHASAENLLPGWGRGGERLSLLLRLRRRLVLAVTTQCGTRAPSPGAPTRGRKILRFLRGKWARVGVPPIWRRKKLQGHAAASAPRSQRWLQRDGASTTRAIQHRLRAWTPTAATTLRLAAALAVAVASVAAFYLVSGGYIRGGGRREVIEPCASWGCMAARFLEPPSLRKHKWLLRLSRLILQWVLLD